MSTQRPASIAEPAITIDGLVKTFGSVRALDGLSLEVARGDVFGLLGRNGSGKTTTVRILTTLTRATSGHARVLGLDVDQEASTIRRRIGATMQEAALDPGMSGREHLWLAAALWGMPRRQSRARADDALERFGLTTAADRAIGTYSGGMQRRLDIATALLNGPAALFLDEPTVGLDPQSRRALWEEIRTLSRDGTTIFLTTQYLEEAEALTDNVAVIDAGRVIAEGTAAVLKARHGRTHLEVRFAHPQDVQRARALIARADAVASDGALHVELDPAGAGAAITDILATLRGAGVPVGAVAVRESSLEDVFVALTGAELERAA